MAREWARAFYKSKVWQDCRAGYIASVQGLCERCLKHSRLTPGHIVHHIKALTPSNITDPEIALSWSNLEYVCLDCHNSEHHGVEVTADGLEFDDNGDLVKKVKGYKFVVRKP